MGERRVPLHQHYFNKKGKLSGCILSTSGDFIRLVETNSIGAEDKNQGSYTILHLTDHIA